MDLNLHIRQKENEHAQIFALRVETILRGALGQDASETQLLQTILDRILPNVKEYLPIKKLSTLDEFFCFWESLPKLKATT